MLLVAASAVLLAIWTWTRLTLIGQELEAMRLTNEEINSGRDSCNTEDYSREEGAYTITVETNDKFGFRTVTTTWNNFYDRGEHKNQGHFDTPVRCLLPVPLYEVIN